MQSLWESIFLSPRDEMSLQHYWVASISFLAVCSRYCSKPRSLLFHPLEVLEIPLSTGVVGETKVDINTSTTIIISCGIVQLSSEHMDLATSRVPPASCRLPIELLQRMYQPLSPIDFDAARHTCRLWLFASLDKTLLTSQLVSGGWQAAGQQDLQEASDYLRRKSCSNIGNAALEAGSTTEWILSQRLKTETRLLPEWRCTEPSTSYDGSKVSGRNIDVHANKFPTTAPSGPSSSNPLANFTVSGCSKFVLLAQDHVVFIYSLANFKAGMTPLTSIIFHRRIVNVSMDTSCGRYAVAILLEGRIGMCCEVAIGERNLPSINRVRPSMSLSDFKNIDVRTPSRPGRATRRQDQGDCASPSTAGSQVRSPRAPSYRRRHHTLRRSDNITFRRGSSLTLTDSNFHNGRGVEFNPPIPNISVNQFFPQEFIDGHANDSSPSHCPPNNMDPITGMSVSTELGARKMYKNLCSIQDPPTSVAICPQRQCVAFGCKTGVELHWIDALRGSPLSRYFDLRLMGLFKLTRTGLGGFLSLLLVTICISFLRGTGSRECPTLSSDSFQVLLDQRTWSTPITTVLGRSVMGISCSLIPRMGMSTSEATSQEVLRSCEEKSSASHQVGARQVNHQTVMPPGMRCGGE